MISSNIASRAECVNNHSPPRINISNQHTRGFSEIAKNKKVSLLHAQDSSHDIQKHQIRQISFEADSQPPLLIDENGNIGMVQIVKSQNVNQTEVVANSPYLSPPQQRFSVVPGPIPSKKDGNLSRKPTDKESKHSRVPSIMKNMDHDIRTKQTKIRIRKCHDLKWLTFFLLFTLLSLAIFIVGYLFSDQNRLIYGVQSDGNICGTKELLNYPYLYVFNYSQTDSYKKCVSHCPTLDIQRISCIDGKYEDPKISHNDQQTLVDNGECVYNVKTMSFFNRCIPSESNQTTDQFLSAVVNYSILNHLW